MAGHAQENGKLLTAGHGKKVVVQVFRKRFAYLVQPDEAADQVDKLDGFPVFGGVEPLLGQMQQVIAELFSPQLTGQGKEHRDQGGSIDFLIQIVLGFLCGVLQPFFQQQIDIFGFFHGTFIGFGMEHGGVLGAVGILPHQIVRQGGTVIVSFAVEVVDDEQEEAVVIGIGIGNFIIRRHGNLGGSFPQKSSFAGSLM